MSDDKGPPFGALTPARSEQAWRRLAHNLPDNYLGRRLASLLLGPAGARSNRSFDVDVFGSQKARLRPCDNICEKRVYLTPQLWDPEDRALLGAEIAAHDGDEFVFVDVGANAGLYTLYARAAAASVGRTLRALCIEPDPEMRRRFSFNMAASNAERDVVLVPCAASNADGFVRFSVNARSRGMSRLDDEGGATVETRTLPRMIAEARLPRVDALKIDVEGHETTALGPLLAGPAAILPRLMIVEMSHEKPQASMGKMIERAGYRLLHRSRMNAVYRRPDQSL